VALAVFLFQGNRPWLLAVEAALAASLATGLFLVRALLARGELVSLSASFLKDRDFGTRLNRTGQADLDELVDVYNDMAGHLRLEHVRQEEKQYFLDRILEASPSGVLTFDFERRISLANPSAARMLGARPDELRGKRLADVLSPFARELETLQPGAARVLVLSGSRRIKVQAGEFLDRGSPRFFLVLEELTEELRRSEKAAYEKLIRMMSHEVNNSLGAARSLLESCLNYAGQLRPEDRTDFTDALAVVIARTEQLSGFVRSFADVVRIPEPRKEPCDVAVIAARIAALVKTDADRRRVAVRVEVRDPLSGIPADRAQMEQVLLNVVKNALEAVGVDGTVTLRTERRAGRAVLVVEDSGPGIAPEAKEQLFRPFFSTKENGQGLGLTLVQEILSRHGFEFSLESSPGEPTRFTIVLG
jgi:two-component system, NtrC family, nitrogen regulation sensor histidine kinase NtrY